MRNRLLLTCLSLLLSGPVAAAGEHQHEHGAGHDHHHGDGHEGHGVSKAGAPASAGQAGKTIKVTMLDTMRFKFNEPLEIKHGDTVRFVVQNEGEMRHEFSISNAEEQKAHAAMMRKMPDMHHEDGNTITLAPGEQGELVWHFDGESEVVFACNIPGHSEAGMIVHYNLIE